MRKLTTLSFLLWAVVIHAQQITSDEAAPIASEFLNSSSPQLTTAKRAGVNKESIKNTSDGTFLYTETEDGTLALTGVAGSGNKLGGDVVLPDETTINGTKYTVTSMLCSFSDILDFENLTGLDIRIPITSIPGWSFYDLTNLKSIKFPSTLQSIEGWAFAYCI